MARYSRIFPLFFLVSLVSIYSLEFARGDEVRSVPLSDADARALVQSDLTELGTSKVDKRTIYNFNHKYLFEKIFGGVTGEAIRQYYDLRISHYFTGIETISISEDKPIYSGWITVSMPAHKLAAKQGSGNAQLGAVNIGMEIWLQSVFDHVPISIAGADGVEIPLQSPRTGAMLLGPAYSKELTYGKKRVVLPPEYRQTILMHEARHSDCTGGLSQKDIDFARKASSIEDFETKFPLRCGHLHVFCKEGDYKDLPACDSEPWGAYAVGAVFADASRLWNDISEKAQIMKMMAIDNYSRLEGYDIQKLLNGIYGFPDMSSTDEGVNP